MSEIFRVKEKGKVLWQVMDYVDRSTLADKFQKDGLHPDQIKDIMYSSQFSLQEVEIMLKTGLRLHEVQGTLKKMESEGLVKFVTEGV